MTLRGIVIGLAITAAALLVLFGLVGMFAVMAAEWLGWVA